MKRKGLLSVALLGLAIAACVSVTSAAGNSAESVPAAVVPGGVPDNATLILYYSKTGSTRAVAESLHARMPAATLAEIRSNTGIMKAVFWHQPFSRNAAIEPLEIDLGGFQRIILCSPIWLQKIASPARAAINTLPLAGKEMHVIITCGGHFGESGQERLKKLVAANDIRLGSLSIIKAGGKTEEEIDNQTRQALLHIVPEENI